MTWHIVPVYYDTETKEWAAGEEAQEVLGIKHSLIYDPTTNDWIAGDDDLDQLDGTLYGILTEALDRLNEQEG